MARLITEQPAEPADEPVGLAERISSERSSAWSFCPLIGPNLSSMSSSGSEGLHLVHAADVSGEAGLARTGAQNLD